MVWFYYDDVNDNGSSKRCPLPGNNQLRSCCLLNEMQLTSEVLRSLNQRWMLVLTKGGLTSSDPFFTITWQRFKINLLHCYPAMRRFALVWPVSCVNVKCVPRPQHRQKRAPDEWYYAGSEGSKERPSPTSLCIEDLAISRDRSSRVEGTVWSG